MGGSQRNIGDLRDVPGGPAAPGRCVPWLLRAKQGRTCPTGPRRDRRPGTPECSDLTGARGDSFATNAMLDKCAGGVWSELRQAGPALLCGRTRSEGNPAGCSPVLMATMRGFPPAILTTRHARPPAQQYGAGLHRKFAPWRAVEARACRSSKAQSACPQYLARLSTHRENQGDAHWGDLPRISSTSIWGK